MKRQAAVYLLFIIAILVIPAIPALLDTGSGPAAEPFPDAAPEQLEIMDLSTGNVFVTDLREYLVGALTCEMPASFEEEALKAQAVAIHSYAAYMKDSSKNSYDFTVDTAAKRGYMTREQRSSYFGLSFSANESKLEAAVDKTIGYLLTYNGRAIAACFHAISTGMTEDSGNVFAASLPYLQPVDCPDDTKSASYISRVELAPADFEDALALADNEFRAVGEPESWLGKCTVSRSGVVLSYEICGRAYTGAALRQALKLRSAAFTAEYSGGKFLLEVRGYGHGVGLSQNQANQFAKGGMTFDKILEYFYKGATLSKSTEG